MAPLKTLSLTSLALQDALSCWNAGQWWKIDVNAIRDKGLASGADANASDSLLINGQPGDLLPCSKSGTI